MAEEKTCNDRNCFQHGTLSVRGFITEGIVVSDKEKKSVVVEMPRIKYIPKYKRYARSKSRIHAHNPDCIGAKLGDRVRIAECRKISKTKAWTVIEILERGTEIMKQKTKKKRE